MSNYGLYYTLNSNIPQKQFPASKKTNLVKITNKLLDQEKEAFILLIYEHFRINSDDNINLIPYSGQQKNKDVIFDLDNFPNELCWILDRFVSVVNNNNSSK